MLRLHDVWDAKMLEPRAEDSWDHVQVMASFVETALRPHHCQHFFSAHLPADAKQEAKFFPKQCGIEVVTGTLPATPLVA